MIKRDELRDSDEAKHADNVERTDDAAKKQRGNRDDGNENADRYEQRTCAKNKLGKCWQRLAAKHVRENLAEAFDAETAPQTEVRQPKDDGDERESDGASKLPNINRVLLRNLFGFDHGRCVATPNDSSSETAERGAVAAKVARRWRQRT